MQDFDPWILDDDGLDRWLAGRRGEWVALDLEADSFHHYHEKICLVQLTADGRDALVDPLAGVDLARFRELLLDPAVTKVFHGGDYDLRLLDRDHGLRVRGLFDTMVAARMVGERKFGLASLLAQHFGVHLDKSHQRADWSRRPLPDAMIAYALEDTRHLAALRELLEDRLRRLGRLDWAAEEFRRVEDVRWTVESDPETDFLRVKGIRKLDRREMTIVRHLHGWRDRRAAVRDVPAFRVAPDSALLAIAREAPSSREALGAIPGVPRPLTRDPMAAEVLDVVREGARAPEVEVPRNDGGRRKIPGVEDARFRRFKAARDAIAERLALEPSLIAPRRVLEAVAEHVDSGMDWEGVPDLRMWQRELLRPAVRDVWDAPPGL